MNFGKTRTERLTGKLNANLGVFNKMITNIRALNEEIELEISAVEKEMEAKQQEKLTMEDIKAQNEKIKSNFEALLG